MHLNQLFVESAQLIAAFVPVDLETGANNGVYVSLTDFDRCTVVVLKAAGTASDDPVITMTQATDVEGTDAKALNFTRIDQKQGATALAAVGGWTEVDQAAGNTYTPDGAEDQGIYCIEFQASDLDVNNGFTCLAVAIPDTGSAGAQLGTAFYILRGARYAGAGLQAAQDLD